MKQKLSLLMLLSIFLSASIFAQLTKSIVDENKVIISTNKDFLNIEPNVLEDFESYADFTTTFPPWILIDVDALPTYGITGVTFPNSGTAMAYIIFNPNNTDPSLGDDPEMAAHSGDKFAACFSSVPSGGVTNDDWLITPFMSLGDNSELSFFGKSYTLTYGAEKLKVLVSTTGTSPADFTEISSGTIQLPDDWTAYNYDLTSYDNSYVYIAFQCLSEDAFILMLDDILVSTDEVTTGGTLTGFVTNALDGLPIEGALVEVAGLSDYSDAQGNYIIENVPAGTLTANFTGTPTQGDSPLTVQFTDQSTSNTQLVTCSASGFVTYSNNQVSIPQGGTLNLDISLSPVLGNDQMRFVLNWGADPSDLDEHLRTPEIEGTQYHVYYANQGSITSAPYAALDHDDVTGYGPETTTIYQFFNGTYHFYIYKYAGTGTLTSSNAVVQVYNETGLIYTLQVPTTGTGDYWYVGTVDGASQALNIINTIQDTEPGTGKTDVEYPKKPGGENEQKNEIISWLWDFGDGQTSDVSNPSHVYQNGGIYTVSLTVSDGTDEDMFVRENYIHVEGQGTGTLTGMVNDAVDGTPIEGALVEVAGLSDYTDAQGNYIIENVPEGTLLANYTGTPTQGLHPLNVQFTDLSTSNTQLVTCSANGYITYNNNQVSIPPGGTLTLDISLSPILGVGQMRFVLNWGADPSDLDEHLRTPEIEGSQYHVYYNNQGSINSAPYAALDHDDVSGYGPETTTIYQFFNGTYHFYIYKYAGTGTLTSSNAVVQVYNETGLIYTLQVPTTGTGDYWYVATVNGTSQALNIINTIQETEPGTGKRDVVYPKKPDQGNEQISEITSWNWNFGDGQSSTLQNPGHIYELDGYYTVSLTVGDGINTHTETKVDYIKVGDEFSIEEISPEVINLYPNPARSNVEFISEFEISQLKIFDNSGRLILDKKVAGKSTIVNVESLHTGIYMVHVYIEDKIITKKLMVQ